VVGFVPTGECVKQGASTWKSCGNLSSVLEYLGIGLCCKVVFVSTKSVGGQGVADRVALLLQPVARCSGEAGRMALWFIGAVNHPCAASWSHLQGAKVLW
jgi:hypothetical protein